jgi:hypothetical protein
MQPPAATNPVTASKHSQRPRSVKYVVTDAANRAPFLCLAFTVMRESLVVRAVADLVSR